MVNGFLIERRQVDFLCGEQDSHQFYDTARKQRISFCCNDARSLIYSLFHILMP